jgi:transcriptional regulator with XRE-family HTH domain
MEAPIPVRETALGEFVRARREAAGLSLRALAELAGVGVRALWELEHGKPTLRMDLVNAVLVVFGKRLGIVDAPRPAADAEPEERP